MQIMFERVDDLESAKNQPSGAPSENLSSVSSISESGVSTDVTTLKSANRYQSNWYLLYFDGRL